MYGSRGANGVIIVTTRQGVTSKPSVAARLNSASRNSPATSI
ncbi:MAG: hypothetical protein ACLU9X_07050 [Alistipes shahii]